MDCPLAVAAAVVVVVVVVVSLAWRETAEKGWRVRERERDEVIDLG